MDDKLPTISLCLIGKNELDAFLPEVISSAKRFVDEIIYVDTGSNDGTMEWFKKEHPDVKLYNTTFKTSQDYTGAKNFAVSKGTMDYILSTDCDEVFNDNALNIKQSLKDDSKTDMWTLLGQHYMGDLFHRDQLTDIHMWINRLWKNHKGITYPDNSMHGLPQTDEETKIINDIVLHHYGFCKNMLDARRRFKTNFEDKSQNRDDFLKLQLWRMITGTYPGHDIGYYPIYYYMLVLMEHPKEIRDKFYINMLIDWQRGIENGIQNKG